MASLQELANAEERLSKQLKELRQIRGRMEGREEKHRGRALARHHATSKSLRDIGPAPAVSDPAQRQDVENDLEAFLRIVFPDVFPWPFSADQRRSIRRQQQIIVEGGLHLDAEPRGTGKTQRALRAALWAIVTGRRNYACVIAATAPLAKRMMKALRTIVRLNETLYGLFPAEIHGFPQMENHNRSASGQLCEGQETGINLSPDQLVFARVPGSRASNSVIAGFGITGSVRGQSHTRLDGSVIRPDLAILDDPQTKESAGSSQQTNDRHEIIHSDVLGLAGPSVSIACSALCTVIETDDLTERLLKEPKWHGERSKTLNAFPKNMGAWDKYFEKFVEFERADTLADINGYYLAHRTELDEGAEVAWEHRVQVGDLSPVQTAMHLWHKMGASGFAAEYQNEPLKEQASADAPTFRGLDEKLTRLPRGVVPVWATKLTAGIDVQKRLLFYVVCAWADDFTGSVIDYGAWPQQSRAYYSYGEAHPTLQSASGATQDVAAWRWGLDGLTNLTCGGAWPREGGGEVRVDRALVDANYGDSTDTVYEFCRRSVYSGTILPSHGRGIKAGDKPMDQWKKDPGETHGFHWVLTQGNRDRAIRHVIGDVNFWKQFLAARAAAMAGEKGSLSIFGERPEPHRMFADHLLSEYPTKTFGRGREVWEWKMRPGADNHFLDCLVLAGIAASICGSMLAGTQSVVETRRVMQLPGQRR